jgi:hypothetical protein
MASSFSIHSSNFSSMSDMALREEVRAHTGCDEEADSILRSIERLGDDPSIWRYEMTPMKQRAYARATRVSWSVRAVRPS